MENIRVYSKYKRFKIEHSLKKADVITATAKFMEEYLYTNFNVSKNKYIRIPWGINLEIFKRGYKKEVKILRNELDIKEDYKVIISNRAMKVSSNIEKIIDIIPQIIEINPKTVFIFLKGYGTVQFENKMRKKAENLGIMRHIRFISKDISTKEMAIFLNLSDLAISILDTDQFACSIMEPMACGVIPIVSKIGVYQQYLKNYKNSFFVDQNNPKNMAEMINYAISNIKILKDSFYQINRKIIEKNEDWDRNARRMEELYEKLQ